MKAMSKRAKIDVGLVAQALNNTNKTGKYFGMQMFRKVLFTLNGAAMAATKTTKIEILQAKDVAGTDAKAITGAEATITANTKVTAATITCASVIATNVVTINGLVFTAAAAADLPKRIFAVGADDTACAASLVLAINHATAGVSGVKATSALGVVTITALDDATITIADPSATITPATTEAQSFVEVDVGSLDIDGGFGYVAAKVTTTANSVVSVTVQRGDGRFEPAQSVGASAVI